ncbi:MAG TPA: DNA-processing protein DprA [Nocardioidaceae bacterium]|nr:DNA-processing protein DprA [Nocardioidaceae bacterium]
MSERLARAALTRLTEPGDVRMAGLVADLGAEVVYEHLRNERDLGGVLTEVASRLRGLDPARDLDDASRQGIRFVVPGDPEWPPSLADLETAEPLNRRGGAPIGLWVRGRLRVDEACARSVAVVGSRSATSYGAGVAGALAAEVAREGVAVVSGAAFGIDQAAHRGALAARGPTVAVLACGPERAYPAAHKQLLDYIAEEGVVVSELPPGCAPTRLRFLSRNRLIAALSTGTVVVEAAVRSGALNTANWATRLHRVLMGVPGPVTSAPSEGVHELIRSGKAALVTEGRHVLELASPAGSFTLGHQRGETRPLDGLEEQELRVLDALPVVHGVSVASLARTAALGEAAVRESLTILRDAGLAEAVDGVWRIGKAHAS